MLKKYGNNIIGYSDDIDTYIKYIEALVENMEASWEGNDATSFISLMKERYIPNLKTASSVINKYGVYLTKVPVAYGICDDDFSKKKIGA